MTGKQKPTCGKTVLGGYSSFTPKSTKAVSEPLAADALSALHCWICVRSLPRFTSAQDHNICPTANPGSGCLCWLMCQLKLLCFAPPEPLPSVGEVSGYELKVVNSIKSNMTDEGTIYRRAIVFVSSHLVIAVRTFRLESALWKVQWFSVPVYRLFSFFIMGMFLV